MGYEYRIHTEPPITNLEAACSSVFANSEWQRIPTSLVDRPDGIGVRLGSIPDDPSWPQDADLCLEQDGGVYVCCHNRNGKEFLRAFVESLEALKCKVVVDDI